MSSARAVFPGLKLIFRRITAVLKKKSSRKLSPVLLQNSSPGIENDEGEIHLAEWCRVERHIMSFNRALHWARTLDTRWQRKWNPHRRRVLINASLPMEYAMMEPV